MPNTNLAEQRLVMEPHTDEVTVHTNRQKHSLTQEHTFSAHPRMLHDGTAGKNKPSSWRVVTMCIHLCDQAVVDAGQSWLGALLRICSLRPHTDVPSRAASAAVHVSIFSLRERFMLVERSSDEPLGQFSGKSPHKI